MAKNVYFVGLDIAADDFVASIYQSPKQSVITKEGIKNAFEGGCLCLLNSLLSTSEPVLESSQIR